MKNIFALLVTALLISLNFSCHVQRPLSAFTNPQPKPLKQKKIFNEHGKQRFDNYFWLSNSKDSVVAKHLEDENFYTQQSLAHTTELQKLLFDELASKEDPNAVTTPVKVNDYWYYLKYFKDSEFPIYYRKKQMWDAKEEEIINVANFAINYKFFNFNQYTISPNGRYLAYTFDTIGDLRHTMFFKDLETGKVLEEKISNVSGGYITWSNDNQYVYYMPYDKMLRPNKVMRHKFGTDPSVDSLIFEENDLSFEISLSKTRSRQYLILSCESTNSNETWYLDINKNDAQPHIFVKRQTDVLYYVNHFGGDDFYVKHNIKAPNFRISKIKIQEIGQCDKWQEVIPHSATAIVSNYEVLNNYIVIQDKTQGTNRIRIQNRQNNNTEYVHFDDETFVANLQLGDLNNIGADSFRIIYTSLKTPPSVYKYCIKEKSLKLLSQNPIKDYKPKDYISDKIFINSRDGERIPVSLVYKKSKFKKNGTNPMLLKAYGAYGVNLEATFQSEIISLLDRGFIVALAHVRGGSEMGGYWYQDGRFLKKKNSFHDFIDCADYLLTEQYTSKERFFAMGTSAGGTIIGAVINERSDLFKAVIAEVPWVDPVTDMLNEDLPLVTLEYGEWGDPRTKKEYDYMLSWSPYDQIKKQNYPAVLASGSFFDAQVPYYNPAKWILKLRDNNTGNNPILFKCDMQSGHVGSVGRYEKYNLIALEYAFLLDRLKK